MKKLALTTALGAAYLALAACGEGETNTATDDAASTAGDLTASETTDGNATEAAGSFPKGARIVEENGVTYRIDPDGTRVALGENDSRIVVENGTRYRVDPDGSRVRIDPEGASIDIDTPDVDLPDVDVGVNEKGNPDVDVTEKSDGDEGPN